MIIYNAELPKRKQIDIDICNNTVSGRCYNKAHFNDVYIQQPELRALLNTAPISKSRKRILIDVKIQYLNKGQYTAFNKDWHLDGKLLTTPRTDEDNIYHMIYWGEAPTVFIKEPFAVNAIGLGQDFLASTLSLDKKIKYIVPEYTWHTYGEHHWHKCGVAAKEGHRIFIRITETNYVKARPIV